LFPIVRKFVQDTAYPFQRFKKWFHTENILFCRNDQEHGYIQTVGILPLIFAPNFSYPFYIPTAFGTTNQMKLLFDIRHLNLTCTLVSISCLAKGLVCSGRLLTLVDIFLPHERNSLLLCSLHLFESSAAAVTEYPDLFDDYPQLPVCSIGMTLSSMPQSAYML
jgi:hypothetical protein